jgi:hypothetical protein
MSQPNDLSRSLVALDQNSTIIAVIEMSQSSWLVAGMLPGIERRKKLEPNPERRSASRASFFYWRARPEPRRRPRISSGRRSTGRIGRKPCPGNSERPRVSRGFGDTNIALRRRARCWDRFTAASPRVSRRQTYETCRRP